MTTFDRIVIATKDLYAMITCIKLKQIVKITKSLYFQVSISVLLIIYHACHAHDFYAQSYLRASQPVFLHKSHEHSLCTGGSRRFKPYKSTRRTLRGRCHLRAAETRGRVVLMHPPPPLAACIKWLASFTKKTLLNYTLLNTFSSLPL